MILERNTSPKVKKIRCRSSGILRLFEKADNMIPAEVVDLDYLAGTTGIFDLSPGRGTEGMSFNG